MRRRTQSVLRLTEVLRPSSSAPGRWPHTSAVVPTITTLFRCQTARSSRITDWQSKLRSNMCRADDLLRDFRTDTRRPFYSSLRKGGDPAAGSPTATLLRLRPSHCARLRRLGPLRVPAPTSGAHSFHGVTGGVYKARERIHRGVADPRLLAIPASCRRVADDNPN